MSIDRSVVSARRIVAGTLQTPALAVSLDDRIAGIEVDRTLMTAGTLFRLEIDKSEDAGATWQLAASSHHEWTADPNDTPYLRLNFRGGNKNPQLMIKARLVMRRGTLDTEVRAVRIFGSLDEPTNVPPGTP